MDIDRHGAVTVSTFWRTLPRDAGRERANSRKSMAQTTYMRTTSYLLLVSKLQLQLPNNL